MRQGTYRIIPVKAKTVTVFALVSPEDYEGLAAHRWYLSKGYAIRNSARRNGTRPPQVKMHREIMAPDSGQVDHINRDRLDNRRENLRIVTPAENSRNTGARKNGTSRHRGVCWDSRNDRWLAQAQFAGRNYYLGQHVSEDVAAAVVARFWEARGYAA